MHLFTGMWERSITTMHCVFVRDLMSAVKLFGLRVTLTPSEKFSIFFAFFCVRKKVKLKSFFLSSRELAVSAECVS